MENIIYGLRDPRNDVYQYIGKSTVGTKRSLSHLTQSHSDKVNEWVQQLNENWLYPIVDVIEEVEDLDNLSEREKHWINFYHDINPNLLNIIIPSQTEFQNIRSDEDEEEFNSVIRMISKIPTILKNERLYRNLTQNEMSEHMGISRSTLSLAERGENVNFNVIRNYLLTLKGVDILTKSSNERPKRKIIEK